MSIRGPRGAAPPRAWPKASSLERAPGSRGAPPASHGAHRMRQAMTEAERLLRDILEHGDIVGRDAAGRTIIQLALEGPAFERLMVFGADAVEAEDGGDDEPYAVPP